MVFFNNVYIVEMIGAILTFIASAVVSTMAFIFSIELKEDIAQCRKVIISRVAILLVGFIGSGLLIYLATMMR